MKPLRTTLDVVKDKNSEPSRAGTTLSSLHERLAKLQGRITGLLDPKGPEGKNNSINHEAQTNGTAYRPTNGVVVDRSPLLRKESAPVAQSDLQTAKAETNGVAHHPTNGVAVNRSPVLKKKSEVPTVKDNQKIFKPQANRTTHSQVEAKIENPSPQLCKEPEPPIVMSDQQISKAETNRTTHLPTNGVVVNSSSQPHAESATHSTPKQPKPILQKIPSSNRVASTVSSPKNTNGTMPHDTTQKNGQHSPVSTHNLTSKKSLHVRMSDEDLELWTKYKSNPTDMTLRNKLVERYLPIVRYQASQFLTSLPRTIQSDDIISDGTLGLIEAIETYNMSRGLKFETYCVFRIRGKILDELRRRDWVPRKVRGSAKKIAVATQKFYEVHGRDPRPEELAKDMGITLEALKKLKKDGEVVGTQSLDQTVFVTDSYKNVTPKHLLEDETVRMPSHRLEEKEGFSRLLRELSTREKILLILYYHEGHTMKQIEDALHLSESRVSQMHTAIIQKLRYRFQVHMDNGDDLDDILYRD